MATRTATFGDQYDDAAADVVSGRDAGVNGDGTRRSARRTESADAGAGRVSPPTSPDTTNPVVLGGIAAAESRALFVEWMELHDGDASRTAQRSFITQLLTLTAGDPLPAATSAGTM